MDATTAINEKLDAIKLLEYYHFEQIRYEGEMIRACCKIHGGNNPSGFVMDSTNGLWYCHTGGCGGGDAFTLVELMEKIPFKEAVVWLARFCDVNITDLQIKERSYGYIEELKKFMKIMKEKKQKNFNEFTIKEEIQEVKKYRKFEESTLNFFKLGFVKCVELEKRNEGKYKLFDRLVFPIFFNGIQVGISFRKTKANDFPKWSHQPVNFETKNILYNYDNVKQSNELVVCEGYLDVWAFHEIGVPAVATFGAHLTKQQCMLLLKTGADIVLAYDGDEAGRKATQKAIEMLKNKANVSEIKFDEGQDPENIAREELRERYAGKSRC